MPLPPPTVWTMQWQSFRGGEGANNPGPRILGGPLLITIFFSLFFVTKRRSNDYSKSIHYKISTQKRLHCRPVKQISNKLCVVICLQSNMRHSPLEQYSNEPFCAYYHKYVITPELAQTRRLRSQK